MIKQKYPGAVSSKSVKDKELERKKEQKRKPGEGEIKELTFPLILKALLVLQLSRRMRVQSFQALGVLPMIM